ncbi:MAG: stress response translation initiation inhibitor YciH [Candidatus Micrarchaeota archaeon]
MSNCNVCGLPKEICACQTIEKATSANIKIYTTRKRYKKLVTIIEGLSGSELNNTAKELKHKLACGGSAKNSIIVLQGDHKDSVVDYLVKLGYSKDAIKVLKYPN